MVIREVHGTLTPGPHRAHRARKLRRRAWLAEFHRSSQRSIAIMSARPDRMAESLLELAGVARTSMNISVVIATKDRAALHRGALSGLARAGRRAAVRGGRCRQRLERLTRARRRAQAREGLAVTYVFEPKPNRGKARNRGIAAAAATISSSATTTWRCRRAGWPHMLRHTPGAIQSWSTVRSSTSLHRRSVRSRGRPITRARSSARATLRFRPTPSMTSAASTRVSSCTDGKIPNWAFACARPGLSWRFAWDAFIWHLKLPAREHARSPERARPSSRRAMARRFLEKHPSSRARMATGAHPLNVLRAQFPAARHAAGNLCWAGDERSVDRSGSAESRARLFSTEFTRAS